MKHIQSVTGDLDVCVTDDGELAIMVADEEGYAHTVKVPDMDELISALRKADLVAMEVRLRAVEREHTAPVLVHQSTIRQVKAIQDARDAGIIK